MIQKSKVNYEELVYFTQAVNEDWTDPEIKGNTTVSNAKTLLSGFIARQQHNRLLGFRKSDFEIWFVIEDKQLTIESESTKLKRKVALDAEANTEALSALQEFLQLSDLHKADASVVRMRKAERIVVIVLLMLIPLGLIVRNVRLVIFTFSILAMVIATAQFYETLKTGKFVTSGRFQVKETVYTGRKAIIMAAITYGILFLSGLILLVILMPRA